MSQGKNKVSQKDIKYKGRIKWNLKTGLSVQMKTTLEILKTGILNAVSFQRTYEFVK